MFSLIESLTKQFFKKSNSSINSNTVEIPVISDDNNLSETTIAPERTDFIIEESDYNDMHISNMHRKSTTANNPHYLSDNFLSKTYSFCNEDTSTINVHLCMVYLDDSCKYDEEALPFLKFLFEYRNEELVFPSILLQCATVSDIETYLLNSCLKLFLEFFVIEGHINSKIGNNLQEMYKGFKEVSSNEIIVVFDISEFVNILLRPSKDAVWLILDDLTNETLMISPIAVDFINKNPLMNTLYNDLNEEFERPVSLYLWNIASNEFMLKSDKSEWVEPRSYHYKLGRFYYFTNIKTFSINYRKYAVFLKNVKQLSDMNYPKK